MAITKVTPDQNMVVGGTLSVAGAATFGGTVTLPDDTVTAGKINFKSVAVTVAAAATSGASAADPDLVGGSAIGWIPTSNIDQPIDSIVVGEDGAVTVTLGAAATADNVLSVTVLAA